MLLPVANNKQRHEWIVFGRPTNQPAAVVGSYSSITLFSRPKHPEASELVMTYGGGSKTVAGITIPPS